MPGPGDGVQTRIRPRSAAPCERTRVRRGPHKGRYDRATVAAILDEALVAHFAFVHDAEPVCIPMLCARVDDQVFVHGSSASRMLRVLSAGAPACLSVTLLDGLVLARSVFEHSANYRSVVVFGRFEAIDEPAAKLAALEAFSEKLLPGRWHEVRRPSTKELKATSVLALPIAEASAKCRLGPPDDDDSADAALDVWAGELPLVTAFAGPVASPGLRDGIPLSPSVRRLLARA